MKSKTMILLVVAVVCGLAASYMTSRLLADRNEKVQVLAAKQRLTAWTPIKNPEEQFEIDERPRSEVPKTAVVKFEGLKDHVLIKGLDKGEIVVTESLINKTAAGLEVQLPAGKRAVAVRTTAEVVVGGFVLPGSHVDVIHSVKRGDRDSDTKVVLQDILVRAVDTLTNKPEDKPGLVPATVTLEVTLDQARILAGIKDQGSITFALRPFGDDRVENLAPPPPPAPAPKPVVVAVKAKPTPKKNTLVIQNGSQWIRATYEVKDGDTQTTVEKTTEPDAPPSLPPAPPAANGPPVQGKGRGK
jgi:pilus assembly protein CpaB